MADVFGLKVPDLADGSIPLEAVAIVEYLDPDDGKKRMAIKTTDGLMLWDVIGWLEAWSAEAKTRFAEDSQDV